MTGEGLESLWVTRGPPYANALVEEYFAEGLAQATARACDKGCGAKLTKAPAVHERGSRL